MEPGLPWIDAALVLGLALGLVSGRFSAAACFITFIAAVIILQRMPFGEAVRLAVEPASVTVLALVVFSTALSRLDWLRRMMFSTRRFGLRVTLARFLTAAGLMSTVSPNTAVVGALMGPAARRPDHSAHNLLLPLSYVALVGGMMTPIGTSANIMVVGEAAKRDISLTVLDFAPVGIVALMSCVALLIVFAPIVLRQKPGEGEAAAERSHVEAWIPPGSELAGRSVWSNRMRRLQSFYLAEIIREGQIIAPVAPSDVLIEGDTLIFVGDVRRIEELHAIRGLSTELRRDGPAEQSIYEAVVSANSILNGRTLKEVGFRARFDASVLAVRRGDERLSGKLGGIRLRAGDLLFLAAGPDFLTRDNVRPNFHLVETDEPMQGRISARRALAISLAFAAFLTVAFFGWVPVAEAAFFLAVGAVGFGWLTTREVRRNFPFDLAVCLWGAVMLGTMIQRSGFAAQAAEAVVGVVSLAGPTADPFLALIAVYALTWLLTELLSNVSAALAALPVALAVAQMVGAPAEAFALAAAFGASASFLVPFGYQTHLMVLTPGGYRLRDFLVLGGIVLMGYSISALLMLRGIWL